MISCQTSRVHGRSSKSVVCIVVDHRLERLPPQAQGRVHHALHDRMGQCPGPSPNEGRGFGHGSLLRESILTHCGKRFLCSKFPFTLVCSDALSLALTCSLFFTSHSLLLTHSCFLPHHLFYQVYHNCLAHRYSVEDRRPVAFWRGSNTDNVLVDRFTGEDFRNVSSMREGDGGIAIKTYHSRRSKIVCGHR